MWPVHCVQNTHGAEFHKDCEPRPSEVVVDKGTLVRVDSYSGFGSPPEKTTLCGLLKDREITDVYVVGLAYDYCVGATAVDAAKNGFKTYLVADATRAVNPASAEVMKKRLAEAGVEEIQSKAIL